jgi:hypothetical protein
MPQTQTQTPTQSAVEKYFDALTQSYDAIIDAVKAANERNYRIAGNLIAEAQRGQREQVELGKTFAADPTDIGGFFRAAMEQTTKAQGRALELARQLFDEMNESRNEGREAIEKVIGAQRAAGEAAIEAARDVTGATVERIRTGIGNLTGQVEETVERATARTKKVAAAATAE